MINLLPPETKKQYRAARMNVVLLRYNITLLFASLFLVGAIGVAYTFLMNSASIAEKTIAENVAKESSYTKVKQSADLFRSTLADAKTTLDSRTNYSRALISIANAMPEESALSTLELNKESFDKPIKLQFFVKDESGARLLLRKLEDSPVISGVTRGNVDIQSTQQARFPFAIDVTLTISKEAAR